MLPKHSCSISTILDANPGMFYEKTLDFLDIKPIIYTTLISAIKIFLNVHTLTLKSLLIKSSKEFYGLIW